MRLFKLLFGTKDTPETGERLDDLEKQFRRLQEEWTDVYAKFRTMQMRVAKQVQRQNESPDGEPQAGGGEEKEITTGTTSSLSPRLQKIQNEILARRRRGGVIPTEGGE
jgi:Sec-independent protein translocase protein TatA